MRPIVACSFFLMLCVGCKEQKKARDNNALEVVDTQMAELRRTPPLTKKDSLQFLKFWNEFYKLLKENDTNAIAKLSLNTLYCPVYSKEFNYFGDNKLVPSWFFIHAPYKQNYIGNFSSYFNKDRPIIYKGQLDNREILDLGFDSGKIINSFSVHFYTEEIAGNYKI